jgi:hypothetical protein
MMKKQFTFYMRLIAWAVLSYFVAQTIGPIYDYSFTALVLTLLVMGITCCMIMVEEKQLFKEESDSLQLKGELEKK